MSSDRCPVSVSGRPLSGPIVNRGREVEFGEISHHELSEKVGG
jgi:hypothetical protein